MKNIHIVSSKEPSRLIKNDKGELKLTIQTLPYDFEIYCYPQHLYITSDEEINEGDVVLFNNIETVICTYSNNGEFLFSGDLTSSSNHHFSNFNKIILTTDTKLITDGVQGIDNEFLEWFVKNPTCEFVEVKKEMYMPQSNGKITDGKITHELSLNQSDNTLPWYKIILTTTIDINDLPFHTIPKSLTNPEKLYTEQEVIKYLIKLNQEIYEIEDIRNWFKNNK